MITKSRNDVRDSQDDLRKLTEEPVSRHACRVSADTTTNAPAAEAVLKTGLDCLADAHSLKTLVSTLETKVISYAAQVLTAELMLCFIKGVTVLRSHACNK